MIIVIEKYPYREEVLRNTIPDVTHFQPFSYTDRNGQKRLVINTVGYCFVPELNDCVFFLPKVVLKQNENEPIDDKDHQTEDDEAEYVVDGDEEDEVKSSDKVFGHCDPESLLNCKDLLYDNEYEFIYQLSVWIYRSLHEFMRLNPKSKIVKAEYGSSLIDKSQNENDFTFIDVLLSLIKFNEDNQDFFMFVLKNIHRGYNKINWRKTIATKHPLIQDNIPVYMNPVNRKKQINFDEELLIIFFSILNYINEQYSFPVKINFNYELITGDKFKNYLDGYGIIRLKQIKYKYFSDKALKLWDLCSKFFERAESISSSTYRNDYMFSNSFQTVFEAIIDDLIGDRVNSLPPKLKKQKDRKIIDHLYKYGDLVHPYVPNANEIYYIGDSKYYKIGASVEETSIYKQYTYAKNVIQYDFDMIFDEESKGKQNRYKPIRYVDKLTEGYNITPNFFISADIKPPYDFEEKPPIVHMKDDHGKKVPARHLNKQFENRLFDRDTLWISHYDISFMTILFLYGRGNDFEKNSYKSKARQIFRQEVITSLTDNYDFYKLEARYRKSLEELVVQNFSKLLGKIYRPKDCKYLILALKKGSPENDKLKAEIDQDFIRIVFDLKNAR